MANRTAIVVVAGVGDEGSGEGAQRIVEGLLRHGGWSAGEEVTEWYPVADDILDANDHQARARAARRFTLHRPPGAPGPPEVDVYEFWWADLSRFPAALRSFIAAFLGLFLDMPAIARAALLGGLAIGRSSVPPVDTRAPGDRRGHAEPAHRRAAPRDRGLALRGPDHDHDLPGARPGGPDDAGALPALPRRAAARMVPRHRRRRPGHRRRLGHDRRPLPALRTRLRAAPHGARPRCRDGSRGVAHPRPRRPAGPRAGRRGGVRDRIPLPDPVARPPAAHDARDHRPPGAGGAGTAARPRRGRAGLAQQRHRGVRGHGRAPGRRGPADRDQRRRGRGQPAPHRPGRVHARRRRRVRPVRGAVVPERPARLESLVPGLPRHRASTRRPLRPTIRRS